MRCLFTFIAMSLSVFCVSTAVYAQGTSAKTTLVGFGFKSTLTAEGPEGQITVPVELGGLRIEPSLGASMITLPDKTLSVFSLELSVQGLFSLSKTVRGYAGGLMGYNRQLSESELRFGNEVLTQSSKVTFFQAGPQLGIEVRVVEGLYVGIEQQVLYVSYLDGDDYEDISALTTRSLLALRVMF